MTAPCRNVILYADHLITKESFSCITSGTTLHAYEPLPPRRRDLNWKRLNMDITLLSRRRLLTSAAAVLGAPLLASAQQRATPLRLLLGFAPGGVLDGVCRKLAERWTTRTGRPAVVENRQGAAGRLAIAELVRAPADGGTLLFTPASTLTMYPYIYQRLDYDPLRDFSPVHTVASTCFALAAGPAVPPWVTDARELASWVHAQGSPVPCGNSGAGGMQHMLATLLAREARLDLTHVPFRGGAPSMQAVAAGDVPMAVVTESSARALHEAGKLRVLATTGVRRTVFPGVPTFREQGWGALSQREWFGAFAPARTPAAIIQQQADMLGTILGEPEVRDTWERLGVLVDAMQPPQLQAALRHEHGFWGPVIRQSGFTPET